MESVMVYDDDSWSRISDESGLDSMGMERVYRGRMPAISDPQLVSDTSAEFNDSATEFEVTIDNGNPTTFDDTHTFYLNYILNVDGVANDDYQTDMQVRGGEHGDLPADPRGNNQ